MAPAETFLTPRQSLFDSALAPPLRKRHDFTPKIDTKTIIVPSECNDPGLFIPFLTSCDSVHYKTELRDEKSLEGTHTSARSQFSLLEPRIDANTFFLGGDKNTQKMKTSSSSGLLSFSRKEQGDNLTEESPAKWVSSVIPAPARTLCRLDNDFANPRSSKIPRLEKSGPVESVKPSNSGFQNSFKLKKQRVVKKPIAKRYRAARSREKEESVGGLELHVIKNSFSCRKKHEAFSSAFDTVMSHHNKKTPTLSPNGFENMTKDLQSPHVSPPSDCFMPFLDLGEE